MIHRAQHANAFDLNAGRGTYGFLRRCTLFLAAIVILPSLATESQAEVSFGIAVTNSDLSDGRTKELEAIMVLVRQRRFAVARERLETFCREDWNHSHPEIILAQILLRDGQTASARATLEKLTIDSFDRLDVHLAFCQLAFAEGRWFDASIIASNSVNADAPDGWFDERIGNVRDQLQLVRAACCEKRMAWRAAKQIYVDLEIGSSSLHEYKAGLARCEFQLGNTKRSLKYFASYHADEPASDRPNLAIAKLCEQKQDAKNAEKYFRLAIEQARKRSEKNDPSHLAYAKWLIWNNRPLEAQAVLGPIAEGQTGELPWQVRYLAALSQRMLQNFGKAERIFSQLHQQQPASFSIANQLALVLIESPDESRRARALQIARANARNQPSISDSWSTLGWVQFKLGDLKQAEASLLRSMQNGVAPLDAATYLSLVKKQLGQSDVAAELSAASQQATGPRFYFPSIPNK